MPRALRLAVLLALAVASSARAEDETKSVCTFKNEDRHAVDGDLRDAMQGGAFAPTLMDTYAAASQDPLTRAAMREDTQRAMSRTAPTGFLSASRPPAQTRTETASRRVPVISRPTLDDAPVQGREPLLVLPGDPKDAVASHDGDSTNVYMLGAAESTLSGVETKSPSLVTQLGRMAKAGQRCKKRQALEAAVQEMERPWGAGEADTLERALSGDTRFFGLGAPQ